MEYILLIVLSVGMLLYILFLQKIFFKKNYITIISYWVLIFLLFSINNYIMIAVLFFLTLYYIIIFFIYRKIDLFLKFKKDLRLVYNKYLYKLFFSENNLCKYLPFNMFLMKYISMYQNVNIVFLIIYKIWVTFNFNNIVINILRIYIYIFIIYIFLFLLISIFY
jgi:hypothetical protein